MAEIVWGGYDRAALDNQYDTFGWAKDPQATIAGFVAASAETRARRDCRLDVPFGEGPDDRLDIFPAARAGAPVVAYFHGGFWRSRTKSDVSRFADLYVPAGACFVAVEYSLVPAVSLDDIVAQCRRAMGWLAANIGDHGGDPEAIHVAGHSAGGHLAAMMAITDWAGLGLKERLVKSACATSGLFDLDPLPFAGINADLRLDAQMARRNAPLRHIPERPVPLLLGWGGAESDEFHRQSTEMAEAWRAKGGTCTAREIPGADHFTVPDDMMSPDRPLGAAALGLLGLGA